MTTPISPTDYKSTSIQGKQRIFGGKFDNPMGGVPSVSFDEELIVYDATSDTTYRNPAGNCSTSLMDPAQELPLRSPEDDSSIDINVFIAKLQAQGKFTDEDFYIAFYSLGRRAQIQRDAVQVVV